MKFDIVLVDVEDRIFHTSQFVTLSVYHLPSALQGSKQGPNKDHHPSPSLDSCGASWANLHPETRNTFFGVNHIYFCAPPTKYNFLSFSFMI